MPLSGSFQRSVFWSRTDVSVNFLVAMTKHQRKSSTRGKVVAHHFGDLSPWSPGPNSLGLRQGRVEHVVGSKTVHLLVTRKPRGVAGREKRLGTR